MTDKKRAAVQRTAAGHFKTRNQEKSGKRGLVRYGQAPRP
jgi:hypothetical protein